jgi:HPt (histidine-containing phosphotransfer) domain-containing protein
VTSEAMRLCKEAGADVYLSKPIEPHKLLSEIDHLAHPIQTEQKTDINDIPLHAREAEDVPLSEAVLDQLSDITTDPEFLASLIDGFLDDSSRHIAELERALRSSEYERARRLSHTLTGSALSIGALQLGRICSLICGLTDDTLKARSMELIDEIRMASEAARTALHAYRTARCSHHNIAVKLSP